MRAHTIVALSAVLLLGASPRAEQQASLDAARELYASAEYDSALAMLDGLLATSTGEDRRSIELYRVLCLVATGRETEADRAIAALVGSNPLFRPSDEVPPRVRTTFNEARRRLLPVTIQSTYQEAKGAYDVKDFASAERGFAQVLAVLADPDMAAQAAQPPLADLRMLASGFHELSAKAAAPPAPPPVVAAAPAPEPVVPEPVVPEPVVPFVPEPGPVAVPPPAAPVVARIYSSDDSNVVPPIVISQRIPAFPGPIRFVQAGVIEVVVSESGTVESAMMRASVDPQYDRLTLLAARSWLYQPAMVDGVPVRFLKRIQLNIVPNPR